RESSWKVLPEEPGNVAGQDVHLEIHVRSLPGLAEGRGREGVRDDVDAEAVVVDLVHRQRDAVESDRALGRDGARIGGGKLDEEAHAVALGTAPDDARDRIDVALDDVAAELVAERERALEIDARAGAPGAERRARQRLARGVDGEAPGSAVDDREADAGAGDRGAERDGAGVVARLDHEAGVATRHDLAHTADVGNDAGEHGGPNLSARTGHWKVARQRRSASPGGPAP